MKALKIQLILAVFGVFMKRKEINSIFASQFEKGLKKYGKTLNECSYFAYNWKTMMTEELVDFINYLEKWKSLK